MTLSDMFFFFISSVHAIAQNHHKPPKKFRTMGRGRLLSSSEQSEVIYGFIWLSQSSHLVFQAVYQDEEIPQKLTFIKVQLEGDQALKVSVHIIKIYFVEPS